jgi:hypothetical protein
MGRKIGVRIHTGNGQRGGAMSAAKTSEFIYATARVQTAALAAKKVSVRAGDKRGAGRAGPSDRRYLSRT